MKNQRNLLFIGLLLLGSAAEGAARFRSSRQGCLARISKKLFHWWMIGVALANHISLGAASNTDLVPDNSDTQLDTSCPGLPHGFMCTYSISKHVRNDVQGNPYTECRKNHWSISVMIKFSDATDKSKWNSHINKWNAHIASGDRAVCEYLKDAISDPEKTALYLCSVDVAGIAEAMEKIGVTGSIGPVISHKIYHEPVACK